MTHDVTIDRDTICAISTPPGVGGIAVARVAGPEAIAIVDRLWRGRRLTEVASHTAHLGTLTDTDGKPLDQAVATVFRGPHSFTGDDVVELSVHGSRFVQRELLAVLCAAGARLAEAGEFTRRAFTSGRMDLAEAEAVADVIASNSRAAHRIAMSQLRGAYSRRIEDLRQQLIDLASLLELELDFSEEEVEFASRSRLRELAVEINSEVSRLARSFTAGTAIKDGIPVAIVGATNAGKSSLLNALLGDDRAIVSDIHGTTRDTIEETLEIGDYLFRFIDTAGLRQTADTIERIGIDRSLGAIDRTRMVVLMIDATGEPDAAIIGRAATVLSREDSPGHLIIALNKVDLVTSERLEELRKEVRAILDGAVSAGVSGDAEGTTASGSEGAACPGSECAGCAGAEFIAISARNGSGLDELRTALTIAARNDIGSADEDILVTNLRHAQALKAAAESTAAVIEGLDVALPPDLIAQDLRLTIHHLSSITGAITSTDILHTIFSRFCIGK